MLIAHITKKLSTCVLLVAFCAGCASDSGSTESSSKIAILFVGKLEWTKIIPDRSDRSNACGRATTSFAITDRFFGPDLEKIELHDIVGEWCSPPYGTEPREYFISAKKDAGIWKGGIHEPILADGDGRHFIAPMYDGIILGCSTATWREELADEYRFDTGQQLSEIRIRHLVNKGYIRSSENGLLLKSVIYLDTLASFSKASTCLTAGGSKKSPYPN